MTPQERQMLREIYDWMQEKKRQQLTLPVDAASKAALGAVVAVSAGSSLLTQNKNVPSTPTTIAVPAAYAGSLILLADGAQYEIGYLQKI